VWDSAWKVLFFQDLVAFVLTGETKTDYTMAARSMLFDVGAKTWSRDILDGLGVGELPDANQYGDEGSNTLGHILEAVPEIRFKNFEKLGLGNIQGGAGLKPIPRPLASWARMAEASAGKDTTSGHWEIAGLILKKPFPTFPQGFPLEIMEPFERRAGLKALGNKPASGTEIIKELGPEHVRTGRPIVYTSADSVFQIAAHEEVIPLKRLYDLCITAREITKPYQVGRVIARPFLGKEGAFYRTSNRRDFSLPPPDETMLDRIKKAGLPVVGIGKINDIFAGRGLTESIHTENNEEGLNETQKSMEGVKEKSLFLVFCSSRIRIDEALSITLK
jgi:phosphopentomutase